MVFDAPPGEPRAGRNPYAAPVAVSAMPVTHASYDPAGLRRIQAVTKDAGQVWLAILMGFVCTALTWVLICPWFAYRLHSWNRLSREYPQLLAPGAAPGSIEAKFQRARVELITGLVVGVVMLLLFVVLIAGAVIA
jgi:uncharacterized integral membrane protein